MAYNITLSDGTAGPTIADSAIDVTSASIPLVGQNANLYGSPIATGQIHMLENFSANAAPTIGLLTGQLWYDKANALINVYSGTGWDPMDSLAKGTTTDGTVRYDATNKWVESLRIQSSSLGTFSILDAGLTNGVAFSHAGGGGDFNIAGTLTTDINVTGVTAVNMPSITLVTALAAIQGGTGTATYAAGDVLYASGINTLAKLTAGANGEVLTLAAGVPTWSSGGGSGTVTSSGTPLNNEVAVFATGTDINSDSTFTWDGTTMFATNVTGTNIGGIASANLINRAAPGTISGTATFTNANPIIVTAGDIDATGGFGFVTTDGAVAAAFRADTGTNDIQFTHSNTPDWNITGLGIITAANPIYATSVASVASFRSIGDAAGWSASDSFMSFYDDDQSDHGLQVGTITGTTASRVNSRLGDLELYASNTLAADIGVNTVTWTSNSITSLVLRNAFLTGANATTSATVADHNDNQHNVGYNETPLADDIGGNINTGSFILGAISIGKFISRTTSTSRTITLNTGSGDIPVGGSVLIHNGASGGTLTIANGTITDLIWIDGSGSVPTTTVDRTLAYNSICTLRKISDTAWQIWGNGIT